MYEINGAQFKLINKKSNMASLASYVEKGILTHAGIERLIKALQEFTAICKPYENIETYPFATASLRQVKNKELVLKSILEKTGLNVQIISGKDEARLSFIGATKFMDMDEGLLLDIGGGSTELVYFKNKKIQKSYSFPIGSLNSYKKYVSRVIPSKIEVLRIKRDILDFLDSVDISKNKLPLYGVGGSIRNIGKLISQIKGDSVEKFTYDDLKNLLDDFKAEKKENLDLILKNIPHRIHTIVPGMIILKNVAKYFKCPKITVSKFGIREGFLFDKVLGDDNE